MNFQEIMQEPIRREIILLMAVLVAVSLVISVLHMVMERNYGLIETEIDNQVHRRDLGQVLVRDLLETSLYLHQLATLHDGRDLAVLRRRFDANIRSLQNALGVLQNGGEFSDLLPLNLPGRDQVNDTIQYHVDPARPYAIEVLELLPRVMDLQEQSEQLALLAEQRLRSNARESEPIEQQIEVQIKLLDTILMRAREQTGRILLETHEEILRLHQAQQSAERFQEWARIIIWGITIPLALYLLLRALVRIDRILEERRATQAELRRALETTETIIEALPVGILIIGKDKVIRQANSTAASIIGKEVGQIESNVCHRSICPAEANACPVFDLMQSIDNSEKVVLTADGRKVSVLKTARKVMLNGEEVLLEAFVDISQRKEAEEMTRLLLESAAEGIFGLDVDGKTTFANPAAIRMLGYPEQELIGKINHTLIHHSREDGCTYPDSECRMHAAIHEDRVQHVTDEVFWRCDGSAFPVDYTSTPIHRDGKVIGAVVSFSDMTERMQTEQLLRRAKVEAERAASAKGDFLARMSHEIRTPMNGVLGLTELLLDTPLNERQRRHLETIHQSGTVLLNVINDILDFSKIETGNLELESIPFALREVLEDVRRLFNARAREKGLDFAIEVAPDVPGWVSGDPKRLSQVLYNLTGNAIKFTDKGGVSIRIKCGDCDQKRVRLAIEVEDSGIGITPEAQRYLFTSFNQADNSTSRKYGGTGLGLAISRQLVQLMGGDISIESKEGEGSLFRVNLHLSVAKERTEQPRMSVQSVTQFPANQVVRSRRDTAEVQPRILLVEDNRVNQEVAIGMLKQLGCRVDIAENGHKALQSAVEQTYDLILMDCHMPEMDGFEATRRIRLHEQEQGAVPVPVIALTADVLLEKTLDAEETGMNDFLSKPFNKSQLMHKLSAWIQLPIYTEPTSGGGEAGAQSKVEVMLDPSSLERLRALQRPSRPDFFSKIVGLYLKDTPALVRAIHDCIACDDGHGLREAAHSLKSSSANLGALQLADTCKELEMLGSSELLRDAFSLIEKLEGEYAQVSRELKQLISREAQS